MKYQNGLIIKVGDKVVADNVVGVVVCDFDRREYLDGYESWDMPDVELVGGGKLSSGIMVKTDQYGLIHYQNEDDDIQYIGR